MVTKDPVLVPCLAKGLPAFHHGVSLGWEI